MPPTAVHADPLAQYAAKRDFKHTPEPRGVQAKAGRALRFVIQKHWASRLHYDFRLELDGVLLSWAVPRGPSLDPKDKRMAVHVEDHPVSYAGFEGTIPPKHYGAGKVIVWDNGVWEPVGDAQAGLAAGKLGFRLHGQKLAGLWELVRINKPGDGAGKQDAWLLFKKRDEWARAAADYDVTSALPDSVVEQPLGLLETREPVPAAQADAQPPAPSGGSVHTLRGAVKRALPATLAPQLATLVDAAPTGDGWIAEHKFDGYRVLARIERGKAQLFTRGGHDWSARLPGLVAALDGLGINAAWLDGEIVVLNSAGVPEFNALQNALDNSRGVPKNKAIVYFLFDAPYFGGMDLRAVPLAARRELLRTLLADKTADRGLEVLRFSETFDAPPTQLLHAACRLHLEGVMLKRADAAYVSGRSDSWLKLKCLQRQEFIVLGYNERSNAKNEIGSLLLGYYDKGRLLYAGNVGTGWDSKARKTLHARLQPLRVDTPTVVPASVVPGRWGRRNAGEERWVRPELVVEVAFAEWTPDGHVRHASFKGIREDKPARSIGRETAAKAVQEVKMAKPAKLAADVKPDPKPTTRAGATGDIKITHPERIIDTSSGITKIELVHYYQSVSAWMLPHLQQRPVSLVRAPDGIGGALFFQKHADTRLPGLQELDTALWPDHAALLAVTSAQGLAAAAQMNVVEFHTWNSTTRSINKPDRMVFDIDPGEGVAWPQIQEAAQLMHALLDELGLQSWLKTSGGKGLHVVVPLSPRLAYPVVKGFSQAIVQHLALTLPQRFVAKSGPSNRVGKVFVDYLRNGHGQTTAAAYSARARPGMGVSMPVHWDQLDTLKGGAQWTVSTARDYLSFEKDDPWSGYWSTRQSLGAAMKRLGYKPAAAQDD